MKDLEKLNNQELLFLIEKHKREIVITKAQIEILLIELQHRNFYSTQEVLEEKQKIK